MRMLRLTIFLLLLGTAAKARENPYDLLGKALVPLANVLAKESGTRALEADLVLVDVTGLGETFRGSRVGLAVQRPDKLRITTSALGEPMTVARDGQRIWAHPGQKAQAVINGLGELPKAPGGPLEPMRLPVEEKQLVFLPAMFRVQDGGDETVDGKAARVLDLELMPELAKGLKVEDWSGRLWVAEDHKPLRLELVRDDWKVVVGFENVRYSDSLPEETFQPTEAQSADLLELKPKQFRRLVKRAFQQ